MNCIYCNNEIVPIPKSMTLDKNDKRYYCFNCHHVFDEKELNKIKDINIINNDINIWKNTIKFK